MATTTAVRPPSATPNPTKMKPPPAPTAPATNAPSSSGMSSSPILAAKRPPSQPVKSRKESQRPTSTQSVKSMGSSQARVAPRKLNEPCVWDTEYILRKHNGKLPSLVLHLHPTHFRFDQQDGSFGYNSPMKIILEHIQSQTVPHEMIEELYRANVTFYDGCLIVEIHNHKTGPASSRDQPQDVGRGKGFVPFSLHNQSDWVTPSPYAPAIKIEEKDGVTAMEKRQSSQGKDAGRKKTVFTTVLHPTQLSRNREIAYMVDTPAPDRSRRGSAVSAGRAATDSPVTPLTPAPALPHASHPASAKK
jgi:transcription factor SPT20